MKFIAPPSTKRVAITGAVAGTYVKLEQAKQACERHYRAGCDLSKAENFCSKHAFMGNVELMLLFVLSFLLPIVCLAVMAAWADLARRG